MPRDGVIFLEFSSLPKVPLKLTEAKSRTSVPVSLKLLSNEGLLLVVPVKPLKAGTEYELRQGAKLIASVKTTAAVSGKAPPSVRNARVLFSPWYRKRVHRRILTLAYAGRMAWLKLTPKGPPPAVVRIDVLFRSSSGVRRTGRIVRLYQAKTQIGSTCARCCSPGRGPRAPLRGTYRVKVKMWSPAGVESKERVLRGRIP